jgi:hypothetical protein
MYQNGSPAYLFNERKSNKIICFSECIVQLFNCLKEHVFGESFSTKKVIRIGKFFCTVDLNQRDFGT